MCIQFTELENGDLRLSLIEDERDDLLHIVDDDNFGDVHKLELALEPYWANGYCITSLDDLRQLSEAPVIMEEGYRENDGSSTLYGKAWYQSDYMIRPVVETILVRGYIDFILWQEFNGENFKTIYE